MAARPAKPLQPDRKVAMPRTNVKLPPECLAEGFYTSELETFRSQPVRTFLPTGYEPNYPYPLLVFFHGHGGNEDQIIRLAPVFSHPTSACIAPRSLHVLLAERQ